MSNWSIVDISVDRLRVDPDVQRGLRGARVNREAERFNEDGLGVITVSDRGNGDLVIIDGQHRVEFVRKSQGPTYEVLCKVFTGLTKQEEAALFEVLNNTERVGALSMFHVRVTKNDPVAIYLKKVVENHGWPLGPGPVKTHFSAVAALERVYKLDPKSDPTAAERAIATLAGAYGHAESAMDGRLVEGLGRFYARYKSAVDTGHLIKKLAMEDGGPQGLIGSARTFRTLRRGNVVDAVADILTNLYNKGRRTKAQLPPWHS